MCGQYSCMSIVRGDGGVMSIVRDDGGVIHPDNFEFAMPRALMAADAWNFLARRTQKHVVWSSQLRMGSASVDQTFPASDSSDILGVMMPFQRHPLQKWPNVSMGVHLQRFFARVCSFPSNCIQPHAHGCELVSCYSLNPTETGP